MKLKAYKDNLDKQIYFKLCETTKGLVFAAVNAEGILMPRGDILSISADGLRLHTNIRKDIGLPLNCNGGLKINGTY